MEVPRRAGDQAARGRFLLGRRTDPQGRGFCRRSALSPSGRPCPTMSIGSGLTTGVQLRCDRDEKECRSVASLSLRWWAFLACLTAWLLDLTALWTSVRAVGVNVGFGGATFVLLVVNAVIVVPSTSGNLGTLETGAVLALALLRVARPQAAAAALLYHGIQLLPLLLFALLNPRLMLGGRSRARLAAGLPGRD